jgi:hypothetical protein
MMLTELDSVVDYAQSVSIRVIEQLALHYQRRLLLLNTRAGERAPVVSLAWI